MLLLGKLAFFLLSLFCVMLTLYLNPVHCLLACELIASLGKLTPFYEFIHLSNLSVTDVKQDR